MVDAQHESKQRSISRTRRFAECFARLEHRHLLGFAKRRSPITQLCGAL